jgi:hypothetical protein
MALFPEDRTIEIDDEQVVLDPPQPGLTPKAALEKFGAI